MRALLTFVTLLFALSANAAPASPESIEALLAVTRAETLIDSMYAGLEQMMRQNIHQSLQGRSITPEQQRALDVLPGKFVAVIREEMSWQKLKPQYVQLYRETFEQEEVDGMLAFYASPAGQALINKMPAVMQKSLALSQSMLRSVMPKMAAAVKEAMKEANIPGAR